MGCDSSGFFSLFSGQSAQCGPVNNQIQQMRGNLDQITSSLERLRGGGGGGTDRDNQRRSVLLALAQNNCGPQYANAARAGGGFLDNLFGNSNNNSPNAPSGDLGPQSGTFRTVCVRTCDGAYFPISFATVPGRFPDDEKTCKALCPATEASLYAYRNPGEDMNQAVSISGTALHGAAERVPLPSGVQSVLRLQGCGPDLVRCAEEHRRQGRRRTAGRHHRHRGERQEDGAARRRPGRVGRPKRARRPPPRRRAAAPDAAGDRRQLQPAPRRTSRSARSARPSFPRVKFAIRFELCTRLLDANGVNPLENALPLERLRRAAARARHQLWSGAGNGLPASRKRLVIG